MFSAYLAASSFLVAVFLAGAFLAAGFLAAVFLAVVAFDAVSFFALDAVAFFAAGFLAVVSVGSDLAFGADAFDGGAAANPVDSLRGRVTPYEPMNLFPLVDFRSPFPMISIFGLSE
jgi:hypothetical protein